MKFNVIIEDNGIFKPYDVVPYFISLYKKEKNKPKTKEEFTKFVDSWAKYRFWARCEYEIILLDWPCKRVEKKIDVYQQIKMNIDIVVMILMNEIKKK